MVVMVDATWTCEEPAAAMTATTSTVMASWANWAVATTASACVMPSPQRDRKRAPIAGVLTAGGVTSRSPQTASCARSASPARIRTGAKAPRLCAAATSESTIATPAASTQPGRRSATIEPSGTSRNCRKRTAPSAGTTQQIASRRSADRPAVGAIAVGAAMYRASPPREAVSVG